MPKISDLPADTAPDSADLIPFVDVDAARTESVTVANLAASAAFTSQYAPLDAAIFIGANQLEAVNGSPTYADVGNVVGHWVMPTTGNAGVGGYTFQVPTSWTTAKISVVWMNLSASSGDAMLRADFDLWAPGDTISATVGTARTSAAPTTANQPTVKELETGVAVTPGSYLSVCVLRISSGETLANTAGVVGILVEKTA